MPEYVYRAITREGVIVKNRVESGNKQSLIKRLKEGNLTPICSSSRLWKKKSKYKKEKCN